MKGQYSMYCGILMVIIQSCLVAAPLIQKISNDTDFGFVVLSHSDTSDCSLHGKATIIQPHTVFVHEFLLENGEPSLVLRPIFYHNAKKNQTIWLTDSAYHYQSDLIEQAFQVFREQILSAKCNNSSQIWLDHWIGRDMSIEPHQVEILGYLLDLSRITIFNNRHKHMQWLSFSKGIFSKLVLELNLVQSRRRGIMGKLKVLHGEGGVCSNGLVERL